ncbi:cytochrome P450 4C1-like [Centruroides sculpturatus]|uniref:cytochrome P450 4C1-like n=1 Tax=Centruroides sculpturatus TaxID=218467 RepID=UPI000C6DF91A|nr:cytochrome P450 4C1-like [Centruroides sculpturatus]
MAWFLFGHYYDEVKEGLPDPPDLKFFRQNSHYYTTSDANVDRYSLMTFRILIGCWILIAFVLTSAYVGTLPSFMVNPGTESIPQTFQELIQSVKAGRYNITFFQEGDECRYFDRCFLNYFIQKSVIKNDVIEIFNENVQNCGETGEKPIPKLLNGTHALLATKERIELSLTKWEKEKVFVSEDILFTKFQFIQINLVRVNYAAKVAKKVNLIEQSGLSQKIYTDVLEAKRRSNFHNYKAINTNDEEPLKIDDIMGSSLQFVEVLNHSYDKEYFPLNFIIVKYLFLYRPDHIQTLLSDSQCINKSIAYKGFKDWIGDSVFMRSDKAYRERKKLLLPAFRLTTLHSFIPIIEKNARKLVEVLMENEKVFIVPVVKMCGFNILYDTILGVKDSSRFREKSFYYEKLINATFKPVLDRSINLLMSFDFLFYLTLKGREFKSNKKTLRILTKERNSKVIKMPIINQKLLLKTFKPVLDRSINFLMSFDFLFYLTLKGREFKSNKKTLRILTKEIIAEKIKLREDERNNIKNNENPKSLLDFLLDATDKNPELTIESICEEIEFILGAAYETTALTVCWSLYLLSQHEDFQRKVQEELDAIFENDIDRFITNEDLHEMKYLECVIKETMRLYPTVPVFSRKIKKSIRLGDKEFSKDWIFVVSIFNLHRNPNIFKNPNVFDPDRFLPENLSKRPPYAYIPFSAGPRMCLGNRSAMIKIKLILATILRKMKIGCVEKSTQLKFRISLNPSRSLQLEFKSRKP